METKERITPCTCVSHKEGGRLQIEVQLPGVDKKDISLNMRSDSFCVSGKKDHTEYAGCFELSHEVESKKAEAKYENGILKIFAPIKDWEQKVDVKIQ